MSSSHNKEGYRNNSKLKLPGVTLQYSEEELREYVKCAQDPVYFCEKYVKVKTLDKGIVPFNLYDYQLIKKMIIHIETNILGRLPEISRFLSHYRLIFDIINQNGNILGHSTYNKIQTEILQLEEIFNVNHGKISNIIKINDNKQYDVFVKKLNIVLFLFDFIL
jgi:hypothetical protein